MSDILYVKFTPELQAPPPTPTPCTDLGRVTRCYVNAYNRTYVHQSRLMAQEQRCLVANFNGAMEAALTPLMERIELVYPSVKVFSLPSVDHPEYGRHIELGVKGAPALVELAYPELIAGLRTFNAKLGTEIVRG